MALKKQVMQRNYRDKVWWTTLKPSEQQLLEALREAQGMQANMKELRAHTINLSLSKPPQTKPTNITKSHNSSVRYKDD